MRHRLSSAALALAMFAMACSDSPTSTTSVRPFDGIMQYTHVEEFIQAAIDRYLPKGFESAVEARWSTVQRKRNGGDMAGAIHEFNKLSEWIDKKTNDITIPASETVTKQQAAALIIVNMGRWLYEGAEADPLAVPSGDVAVEVVPAGAPLALVVPSKHASVSWGAGSTVEDRVIVILEEPNSFPGQCQGPLNTRRCQYPLFYQVHSFPDLRLQTPGRVGVCMVTTGDRRPIEYPQDEPLPEVHSHGPVHERMRLAHNLPANPADRHPQGIAEDGIEILPLVAAGQQSGLTDCNSHSHASLPAFQKAVHSVMHFAGRILSPKNAYAFNLGPEHEFSFFSSFNGVDPLSVPDVSISGLSGVTTSDPGATIQVSYRVANRSRRSAAGNATARSGTATVTLFLSADETLDEADELIEESEQVIQPLWPGDSTGIISQNVTLPESPGQYYVIAQIVQDEEALAECEPGPDAESPNCFLGNNVATHAVTVTAPPGPGLVLFGVEAGGDGLSIIDPVTGVQTFVNRLSEDEETWMTPVAAATDPTTGTLYAWNNSGPSGVLLTINTCTGRGTQVNEEASGVISGALAASPQGQLYLLGQPGGDVGSSIYSVNKATGALTAVAPIQINSFAADFDPRSGTLYAIQWTSAATTLYTVDLTTGAATSVGQLSSSLGVIGSMVFTPAGGLIGSAFGGEQGNILFDIDPATAEVSNVRSLTGGTTPQGLGFATGCPIR